MRQLLADKVSGPYAGLWLLAPELLRLGAWDLILGWSGRPGPELAPRLALQLVGEAALCVGGVRQTRSLAQRSFALACGLPFAGSDQAVHDLLEAHTVAEAETLQAVLGRLRRASGHYRGRMLAIDPHHLRSHTRRETTRRTHSKGERPAKTLQTFFCLDADTSQPLAFAMGSAARTATDGAIRLLDLAAEILGPAPGQCLVLADKEHCTAGLFGHAVRSTPFDLLVPMPDREPLRRRLARIPGGDFTERWAGLATATRPFAFSRHPELPLHQIVQRLGERPDEHRFDAFVCTARRDEAELLTREYPARWRIEEFFRANQDLGWRRAGTLNLHIRYGRATMALVAQAAIHQLRQRLGEPCAGWDAAHLAEAVFRGLEGDVRVVGDTILVTYYNAPSAERLREHYEGLPAKLANEGVPPEIPWLYDYKLDFRFK